jgi:hypothetical protein
VCVCVCVALALFLSVIGYGCLADVADCQAWRLQAWSLGIQALFPIYSMPLGKILSLSEPQVYLL